MCPEKAYSITKQKKNEINARETIISLAHVFHFVLALIVLRTIIICLCFYFCLFLLLPILVLLFFIIPLSALDRRSKNLSMTFRIFNVSLKAVGVEQEMRELILKFAATFDEHDSDRFVWKWKSLTGHQEVRQK